MKYVDTAVQDVKTDVTWNRAVRYTKTGVKKLPRASGRYVIEKFPIIGWLPKYNPRWLIQDFIAGLTLGLMLIPQGLSYARIADIPVEYGLMSSWLPGAIAAFMGTSKDLSSGPTSLIGLLTSETVHELQDQWTPSQIASATAMVMGIYGMIIGFLKLGFLLEFISSPVLSGFITAIAITIILNQLPSLLGLTGIGSGTANQIHDIFAFLPRANGWDCLIGFTSIAFLTILEKSGARWGKKNKVIWLLGITRAFLTLVLFTGISYAVNKDRGEDYLFRVVQVQADGQEAPTMPPGELVSACLSRSIAVFVGAAVEHVAIARAFSVKNNYATDQSQELCYFGITNFFNSFFHAMGIGGAMSRTAVNSNCNVKSPLSGLVTMAVVLICVYELVETLFWIPNATLAAIIITAVWNLISPPATFYKYWKSSLADFIGAMIALWVSLFVNTEIGIGAAVVFQIFYVLIRQVFTSLSSTGSGRSGSDLDHSMQEARMVPRDVPRDTRVFRFNESLFFPNAFNNTTKVLDDIQTFHAPVYNGSHGAEAERNWSVVSEQRVARLRREAGINDVSELPPINLIILDFGRVNFIDTTAVNHLKALVNNLKKYGGKDLEIRFVSMLPKVRERFERTSWHVINMGEGGETSATYLYPDVATALSTPRRMDSDVSEDTNKPTATHNEKQGDQQEEEQEVKQEK